MISCDRCGEDIGQDLKSQTYRVFSEKLHENRGFYTPRTSLSCYLQLCGKCHDKLCAAVTAAIGKCLKSK